MDEPIFKKMSFPDKAVIVFVDLDEIPGYASYSSHITSGDTHVHISQGSYLSYANVANNAAVTWPSVSTCSNANRVRVVNNNYVPVFREFLSTPQACAPCSASDSDPTSASTAPVLPPHPQSQLPEPLNNLPLCVLTSNVTAYTELLREYTSESETHHVAPQNTVIPHPSDHGYTLQTATVSPCRSLWLLEHYGMLHTAVDAETVPTAYDAGGSISTGINTGADDIASALWEVAEEALVSHHVCVLHIPGQDTVQQSRRLWEEVLTLARGKAMDHGILLCHVIAPPRTSFTPCRGYTQAYSPSAPVFYDVASIFALAGLSLDQDGDFDVPKYIRGPGLPPVGRQPTLDALLCSTWWPGITRLPTPPRPQTDAIGTQLSSGDCASSGTGTNADMGKGDLNVDVNSSGEDMEVTPSPLHCECREQGRMCIHCAWHCEYGWLGVTVTDGPMTVWEWLRYVASVIGQARKYGA